MGVKQTQQTDKRKKQQSKMPETRVPMTLRDHFLQDPFFKSAWEDMDTFRGSFFKNSQSQSAKMIETSEKQEGTMEDSGFKNKFGRYLVPRKWMMPSLWSGEESLKLSDSSVINLVDDETKLEISLNTAGYQPSELSVNVGDGELVIEGRHEERSQTGEMMVSRQFRRQYGLPPHTKLNQVVSNLSEDGVLVVTVPKEKRITELKENKIKMERKKSVELSLDTAGYKPDELKVTAGRGVVCVEGKHEEKSQSGEVMVSRQMSRQYHLPASADQAQVTSNLSRDGVLLITIPKIQQHINQDRNVPITMN